MPDKSLNFRDLRRALLKYGGWEDTSRGKGSHTMFFRKRGTSVFSFPLPTKDKVVKKHYVKALREQLGLTEADGILDDDFYGN